ncbi:uncharacterized protein LOC132866568 [Neoarius graeffei]|uniref:uncharacterized protein LOC132866568 n=1 Tax=Neoarius graeffei TaxID=443677 RepID=UPI00298CC7F1|nr:uncharacterized protein LOC132866568 [Neoarius graeffei]
METPKRSTPASREQRIENEIVQLKIKVQTLLENQGEILHLHRRMSANSLDGGEPVEIEDLIPQPLCTKHELQELCDKLEQDDTYRGKMIKALAALGGRDIPEGIRLMCRHIAENWLWEQYSMKGRKDKVSFQNLRLCRVLVKAAIFAYKKKNLTKEDVLQEVADVMKYVAHRPGGSKYKPPKNKTQNGGPQLDDSNTENDA